MQAVYRQNAGQLVRAFFVQLPLALLLGVVAVQIVILCLSATDALCTEVAGGSGLRREDVAGRHDEGFTHAVADPTMATFVLLLVGLLVAAAAFVLWLELLVRAAAVYVAVLFLPLAMATLVWPSVAHWCRRLVETLTALILSKFVIVATLSLAAGAVGSGTAGTGDAGSGFASVLAGAPCSCWLPSSRFPFSVSSRWSKRGPWGISKACGNEQRPDSPICRGRRHSHALKKGMAAHGAAKLAAQAGPPGTGGGGTGGSGMGARHGGPAAAPVGSNGTSPCHSVDWFPRRRVPGSEEAFMERMRAEPKPKGPKPLLPSPAEMRAARQARPLARGGADAVPSGASDSGAAGRRPVVKDGCRPVRRSSGNRAPMTDATPWATNNGSEVWGLRSLCSSATESPPADGASAS